MARQYMISKLLSGTELQITEDREVLAEVQLVAASDPGIIREAEDIINEGYYKMDPFPGFHWQQMGGDGWRTTDHDLK